MSLCGSAVFASANKRFSHCSANGYAISLSWTRAYGHLWAVDAPIKKTAIDCRHKKTGWAHCAHPWKISRMTINTFSRPSPNNLKPNMYETKTLKKHYCNALQHSFRCKDKQGMPFLQKKMPFLTTIIAICNLARHYYIMMDAIFAHFVVECAKFSVILHTYHIKALYKNT